MKLGEDVDLEQVCIIASSCNSCAQCSLDRS
jgi:hypothetical protein